MQKETTEGMPMPEKDNDRIVVFRVDIGGARYYTRHVATIADDLAGMQRGLSALSTVKIKPMRMRRDEYDILEGEQYAAIERIAKASTLVVRTSSTTHTGMVY